MSPALASILMAFCNGLTTPGDKEEIVKLLAISGSARKASTNTALLKAMQHFSPADIEWIVLHDLDTLPVFSPDLEGNATPSAVNHFLEAVSASDGIIISSPEYVRAIPGGLKNAIDWMVSRFEIVDKPIALVHASHRGDDMLASLRLVLSTVSKNFIEPLFLRIPVIGKTIDEIETLVCLPENQMRIQSFILDFANEVHDRKESIV